MAYGGHEGGLSAKRETLRPGNSGRFLSSRPSQLWRRPGVPVAENYRREENCHDTEN